MNKFFEKVDNVLCNRSNSYGEPENSFEVIAEFWSTYLSNKLSDYWIKIDGKMVADMMMLLKIARTTTTNYKEDNYIDIVGYAMCAVNIEKSRNLDTK